jgi:hypothetical protein
MAENGQEDKDRFCPHCFLHPSKHSYYYPINMVRRTTEHRALRDMVKQLRDRVAEYAQDAGPCDHAVNICVCGITDDVREADELLAWVYRENQ